MLVRYLFSFFLFVSLTSHAQNDAFIENVLKSTPIFRDSIQPQLESFELQVIYRPLTGVDSGLTYRYNVDPERYFYPASTVKLPTAALALQWINEQGIQYLSRNGAFYFEKARKEQIPSPNYGMPNKERKKPFRKPTMTNFIGDAMIVSNNMAYNRLFDLLGQRYINTELHRRGWRSRILHRVGVKDYNAEANRWKPPVMAYEYFGSDGEVLFERNLAYSKTPYNIKTKAEFKGIGRYEDSLKTVISEPFDFSTKNFLALEDLGDILQAIVLPASVDSIQRFEMSEADRRFLVETLSTRPKDSPNPAHHDKPDGYVNFLYYGGDGNYEKDGPKIYNKVGIAYGTLTEAAVFAKADGTPQFLLSATINVNRNGIYNDGVYAYDAIGFPFLKALGRAFWELER